MIELGFILSLLTLQTYDESQAVEYRYDVTKKVELKRGLRLATDTSVTVPKLDVSIRVTMLRVGLAQLEDGLSEGDHVTIEYEIENLSATKKQQYTRPNFRTWERNQLRLRDEHKNSYKWIDFAPYRALSGRVGVDNESIYPGARLRDRVAFERPIEAATKLYLELPLSIFDGRRKDSVTFELEVSAALKELASRRTAFEATKASGLPGLTYGESIGVVLDSFKGLKLDDGPGNPKDPRLKCFFGFDTNTKGSGYPAPINLDVCFLSNQLFLYRLSCRSCGSESAWIAEIAKTLGPPRYGGGGEKTTFWQVGHVRTIVSESDGRVIVEGAYEPLLSEAPQRGLPGILPKVLNRIR